MGNKTLLLIGGLILGVLVIFAGIGLKNTFLNTPTPSDSQMGQDGWEPSYAPSIIGLPGNETDSEVATPPPVATSRQDVPVTGEDEKLDMELVGEPDTTTEALDTQDQDTMMQVSTPDDQPETLPPHEEQPATIATLPDATATVEPPTPTPATDKGKLEIVLQAAENGKPLKANVYIQQTNGVNIDQSNYTNKASFNLTPGTYRVTARTEGRGTLSRNISIPAGAVVNEIFPLPALASTPAPTPQAAPVTQTPPSPAAQTPVRGTGKIRLVALSADDGSPVPVSFTIARPDGSVVNSANNVSVAEFTLPTEEFVASFDFQGRQGYQSLVVQGGQTHTHTFNIRLPPAQATVPAPAMQQPQNVEDMLRQRFQQELNRLTN